MHRRPFLTLLLSSSALLLLVSLSDLAFVFCQPLNRSIDDSLGDSVTGKKPLFLPSTTGVWQDEKNCNGCDFLPPPSDCFDGTYTAATYYPSLKNIAITFEFIGTAIYVFFILSWGNTAANFALDGSLAGTFVYLPIVGAPSYQFNESALAFSKTDLENITHQMVISTTGIADKVWVNFDYALYTFEDATSSLPAITPLSSPTVASPSSSFSSISGGSSKQTGAIAGAIVGGLIIIGAVTAGIVFYSRRRSHKHWHEVFNKKFQHHYTGHNMLTDPFLLTPQQNYIYPFAYKGRKEGKKEGLVQTATKNSSSLGPVSSSPFLLGPSISRKIVPVPTGSAPVQIPTAELRQVRRRELECQMRAISDEIEQLRSEQNVFLERQQELAQAMGLSDESLPRYSNL